MPLTPPPARFSGPFSEFFDEYVVPNLPSPERVAEFDQLLRTYLATADPVHVVRFVRPKDRQQVRGEICVNSSGDRMLPSDNSPVWWLHAYLCTDEALPTDLNTFFSGLPTHFHRVPKGRIYLNKLGFHAAHIENAKNGNTDWKKWTRHELMRRTLVNIHPCNMFLVSKTEWQAHGGRAEILNWVTGAYIERYGSVMRSFLSDVGFNNELTNEVGEPHYEYGQEATIQTEDLIVEEPPVEGGKRPLQVSKSVQKNCTSTRPQVLKSPVESNSWSKLVRWFLGTDGQLAEKMPEKIWQRKRPHIKKSLVGTETWLEIQAGYGNFRVPHDTLLGWVGENLSALDSNSWTNAGEYHWPKPSKKMMTFLEFYRV